MSKLRKINIVYISGREKKANLRANCEQLMQQGWQVEVHPVDQDESWPFNAGPASARCEAFERVLADEAPIVWTVRGGYGASNLLSKLRWPETGEAKLLVGFSDFTAILSSASVFSHHIGVHGSMPGGDLFALESQNYASLLTLFDDFVEARPLGGEMQLKALEDHLPSVSGQLFGGNFAVLSNLIGTPHFPKDLSGRILLLEDTGEPPGRLLRFWDQLELSGVLKQLSGVIIGDLDSIGEFPQESLAKKFAQTSPCPVWVTDEFGHGDKNRPFVIGANAVIEENRLRWEKEYA